MSDFDQELNDPSSDIRGLGRERRIRVIVSLIVVSLIVTIPLLLFGTTAFQLKISPESADKNVQISTQGGWAVVLSKRVVLFGQSATLQVTSPQYLPTELRVDRQQKSRVLELELVPRPGTVTFHIQTDHEVSLSINGSGVEGKPPYKVELESGTYTAAVDGREIVPLRHTFEVVGLGQHQEIHLVTEPSSSSINIQTQPPSATIEVNGEVFGQGSYSGSIPIGEHSIRVAAPNYFPSETTLEVAKEQEIDLGVVSLRPRPALVSIASTPSDASILIGGDYVGSTPSQIEVQANETVDISVRKPNYHPQTKKLVFDPGQSTQQSFELEPIQINVNVSSTPDATVWLNDTRKGTSPLAFQASPNDTIRLTKQGYAPQSFNVESIDEPQLDLDVVLVDELEDKFNKSPQQVTVQGSISLNKIPPVAVRIRLPTQFSDSTTQVIREFELTRAFYLGTYEVRKKEFALFKKSLQVSADEENLPITGISWIEAAKFCNWLSAQENLDPVYRFASDGSVRVDSNALGFRLPTEAEWEVAAQYDTRNGKVLGIFPWGSGDVPRTGSGNFSGRESSHGMHPFLPNHSDNHVNLAPVGSYKPNENGFHDLAGNASEWVHDFYESRTSGLNRRLKDPLGPESGIDRMVKGANFRTHNVDQIYTNTRRIVGSRDETVGFRVARWIW